MVWKLGRTESTTMTEEGDAAGNGDSPTVQAQKFLEGELQTLEGLASEQKLLEYHNHCLGLLAKESSKCESLNKLLADIEGDGNTEPLLKSDVLKEFAQLCMVLKNAAEQNENMEKEERKSLAEEYDKLFNRAEMAKNHIEYEAAKQRGFEGDFDAYIKLLMRANSRLSEV